MVYTCRYLNKYACLTLTNLKLLIKMSNLKINERKRQIYIQLTVCELHQMTIGKVMRSIIELD